jgi:hypothetical protein
MHAVKLVSPAVLLMLCIGLFAFIVVFRGIFSNKKGGGK